jgi:hypothetical protein
LLSEKFGNHSSEFNTFKKLQNREYDVHSEYRLAYQLRNYTVHVESPITTISIGVAVKDGATAFKLTIEIDPKKLLATNYKWTARVRADLEALDSPIDLIDFISSAGTSLDSLAVCRIGIESLPAVEALNNLDGFIREVLSIHPQHYPCILPGTFGEQPGQHRIEWFPMASLSFLRASMRI